MPCSKRLCCVSPLANAIVARTMTPAFSAVRQMSQATYVIAIALGALISISLFVVVAYRVRHSTRRAEDLFFAGRDLTASDLGRSLVASWMSVGNVIVGAIIVVFTYGLYSIWAVASWILGFLILRRHAAAIRSMAGGDLTLHRFLGRRYSSRSLPRLTSLLTITTAAGVLALELIVGAALVQSANETTTPAIVVLMFVLFFGAVAVIYTALGGFLAVIRTDRLQTLLISAGVVAILLIAINVANQPESRPLSWSSTAPTTGLWTWVTIYGAFILGFGMFQLFLLPGDMMTWQRLTSSGSEALARRGVLEAAVVMLLLWSALLAIGALAMGAPEGLLKLPLVGGTVQETLAGQAEPLTSLLASTRSCNPQWLQLGLSLCVACAGAGLVAAILSTSDSFLLVISQTITLDWIFARGPKTIQQLTENATQSRSIARWARWLLVPIAMLPIGIYWLIVLLGIPLVPVIFFMFSFQCAITPIAVQALRTDLDVSVYRRPAVLGLVLAGLAILVLFALSGTTDDLFVAYAYSYLAPVLAITLPIVVFVLSDLVSGRPLKSLLLPVQMVYGTTRWERVD